MPDFERVMDDLSVHVARTPEDKAYAKGVIAGKRKARIELVIVLTAIYFTVAAIGHYVQ